MSELTLVEQLRKMGSIKTSALYSQRTTLNEAADRIAALERACRACQASPYDEDEYLDAMEAAMGVPSEPGKWCGPGSPAAARIAELEKAFGDCIHELKASGLCHDHPCLVKYRSVLTIAASAAKEEVRT